MPTAADHATTAQALMAGGDQATLLPVLPVLPTAAGPFSLDDAYAVAACPTYDCSTCI